MLIELQNMSCWQGVSCAVFFIELEVLTLAKLFLQALCSTHGQLVIFISNNSLVSNPKRPA